MLDHRSLETGSGLRHYRVWPSLYIESKWRPENCSRLKVTTDTLLFLSWRGGASWPPPAPLPCDWTGSMIALTDKAKKKWHSANFLAQALRACQLLLCFWLALGTSHLRTQLKPHGETISITRTFSHVNVPSHV